MLDNGVSSTYKIYYRNKQLLNIISIFLIIGTAIIAFLFLIGFTTKNLELLGIIILFFAFLLTSLFILYFSNQNRLDKIRNNNTWGKGSWTEYQTLRDLINLGPDYKIISDFPNTGKGNIDFIVICQKGIFTIEVKAEKGTVSYNNGFYIDGRPSNFIYIKQAQAQQLTLEQILMYVFNKHFKVQSVFEFRNGTIDRNTIHGKIEHVWIGGRGFYKYAIKKSSYDLSEEEIERIYNYLINLKSQRENIKYNFSI